MKIINVCVHYIIFITHARSKNLKRGAEKFSIRTTSKLTKRQKVLRRLGLAENFSTPLTSIETHYTMKQITIQNTIHTLFREGGRIVYIRT